MKIIWILIIIPYLAVTHASNYLYKLWKTLGDEKQGHTLKVIKKKVPNLIKITETKINPFVPDAPFL